MIIAAVILIIYRIARSTTSPSALSLARPSTSSSASTVNPAQSGQLKLAPSQVRPQAAKLIFSNGRVQEVFPLGEEAGFEPVWKGSELRRVELPVGARLSFVYEGGGLGKIERGLGDECEDGRCDGIAQVRIELNLLRGLEQFKLAREFTSQAASLSQITRHPADADLSRYCPQHYKRP